MTLKVVERPRQALNISVYEGDEQLVASATHEPSPNDPGKWKCFAPYVGSFTIYGMPDYAMKRLLLSLVEGAKIVQVQEEEAVKEAQRPAPKRKRTTPTRGGKKVY